MIRIRRNLDDAITYGATREARKLAKEGLKKAKDDCLLGEEAYFKAQIEILKDNYDKAIKYLDDAIVYNPNDGAAFNDRALCMVELGIIDEAIHYFNKGIEVEPDYATIYHNKGWLLNKIGHYTEAIKYFKKALELEPNRAVTYENLADAYRNLSQYEKALQSYKKALHYLRPDCVNIKKQISRLIKSIQMKG